MWVVEKDGTAIAVGPKEACRAKMNSEVLGDIMIHTLDHGTYRVRPYGADLYLGPDATEVIRYTIKPILNLGV